MPPRRRRSSNRGPKARYAWETSVFDPASVGPGAETTANLASDSTGDVSQFAQVQGLSVVRIIGSLRVNSTHASLSVEWAAGIAMIEDDAFAANVVPDPLTQPFKWMWWMARVSPPPGAGGSSIQIELDIKARRRFPGGTGILGFIINNHDVAETLEFALSTRVLLRLP